MFAAAARIRFWQTRTTRRADYSVPPRSPNAALGWSERLVGVERLPRAGGITILTNPLLAKADYSESGLLGTAALAERGIGLI
jgi:hypothetical protein